MPSSKRQTLLPLFVACLVCASSREHEDNVQSLQHVFSARLCSSLVSKTSSPHQVKHAQPFLDWMYYIYIYILCLSGGFCLIASTNCLPFPSSDLLKDTTKRRDTAARCRSAPDAVALTAPAQRQRCGKSLAVKPREPPTSPRPGKKILETHQHILKEAKFDIRMIMTS